MTKIVQLTGDLWYVVEYCMVSIVHNREADKVGKLPCVDRGLRDSYIKERPRMDS